MNCRLVLVAQECINGLLSSPVCAVLQTESDDPRIIRMNIQVRTANTSVNYVCRENVEGILHINANRRSLSHQSVNGIMTHRKQQKRKKNGDNTFAAYRLNVDCCKTFKYLLLSSRICLPKYCKNLTVSSFSS